MCVCVCVCVCVCGCPVGSTGRVLGLQPRGHWFESQSRRKKNHHMYSSPPADPSVKRVPGLVLGRQSSLAVVMYNRRSMWAHVHASCCDHSWMLLQDAWPGFRRYHHASTGPRTCLVHRNPSTYVSILTAGSASPPAHSWCGITSTFMV